MQGLWGTARGWGGELAGCASLWASTQPLPCVTLQGGQGGGVAWLCPLSRVWVPEGGLQLTSCFLASLPTASPTGTCERTPKHMHPSCCWRLRRASRQQAAAEQPANNAPPGGAWGHVRARATAAAARATGQGASGAGSCPALPSQPPAFEVMLCSPFFAPALMWFTDQPVSLALATDAGLACHYEGALHHISSQ